MYLESNGVPTVVQEVDEKVVAVYDAQGYKQYAGDPTMIPATGPYMWEDDTKTNIVVDTATLAIQEKGALLTQYEQAIQTLLDDRAKLNKWDNMASARAAAGIPLAGTESPTQVAMHTNAVTLSRWYLAVWGDAVDILNAVETGAVATPTVDELIALLPTAP